MYVLFDLDGTLVDSGPAHRRAAENAFRDRGLVIEEEVVVRFLVAHDAASADMPPDVYFDLWKRMQPLYRLEQESIAAFPGIADLLASLPAQGIRPGIVTSKRRWAVERELRRLGWLEDFACVVCRDDTQHHKPSPEPILHAMRQLGGRPVAYVGDAPSDVQAAKAAGLPAIGVIWGWAGGPALRAAGADFVLEDPAAILPLLREIGRADLEADA